MMDKANTDSRRQVLAGVLATVSLAATKFVWAVDGVGPPPDGIYYQIVSTASVIRTDVRCGINELGLPNPAYFRRERRRYREFKAGEEIRTWLGTTDVFDYCKTS